MRRGCPASGFHVSCPGSTADSSSQDCKFAVSALWPERRLSIRKSSDVPVASDVVYDEGVKVCPWGRPSQTCPGSVPGHIQEPDGRQENQTCLMVNHKAFFQGSSEGADFVAATWRLMW